MRRRSYKKKDCFENWQLDDGSFKAKDGSKFDGCVHAFSECATGVDDPEALCAYIGRQHGKISRIAARSWEDFEQFIDEERHNAYRFARSLGESRVAARFYADAVEDKIVKEASFRKR